MANTLKFGNGEWYGKEDTILAYNDENKNFKPLPFDFERGSVATRINKEGLIETVGANEPRVDYKDDVKGAMLLEPSRTNYLLQSNSLDQWSKSTSIEVTGGQLGVGGSDNAWLINRADTGARYVQASSTVSGTQVLSFYAKPNTTDWIWVFNGADSCYLDISNGVQGISVGFTDITFELMGNSWYRVSLKTDNTTTYTRIYPANTNGSVTGNLVDLSIYIQHAQLEQGSYSTSLINTQGTVQTRLGDTCSNGGNDQVFNSLNGTLYTEMSALANDLSYRTLLISNGTSANKIGFYLNPISNSISFQYKMPTNIFLLAHTLDDITSMNKIAFAWSYANFRVYVNGIKVLEQLSGATNSSDLNQLDFSDPTNVEFMYSNTKDLRVYNTALTDQELAALTQV